MTDRDMSYDLDASFASRNDGEMQNIAPMRSRFTRSPGINTRSANTPDDGSNGIVDTPLPARTERYLYGPTVRRLQAPGGMNEATLREVAPDRDLVGPAVVRAGGMADLDVDIPLIGKVNLLHIGIAVGVTMLACKMLSKKG